MDSVPSGRIRSVLFDLDGTLVDSAPDLHRAANDLLTAEGRRTLGLDDVKMMVGDGVLKLVERAFAATGDAVAGDALDALSARFLADYEVHATDLSTLFPGTLEGLQMLRSLGYNLAVCTNKPHKATLEILGALEVREFFPVIIGGDSVGNGIKKPDPRHLQAAIEGLGADVESTVMIGDSGNDINAARGAGIPVIVVSYGYTHGAVPADMGADDVIDSCLELPALLPAM